MKDKLQFLPGSMKYWTPFFGIGAVVGALTMWIDPTGKMWALKFREA